MTRSHHDPRAFVRAIPDDGSRVGAVASSYCSGPFNRPNDAPPLGHPGRRAKAEHLAELLGAYRYGFKRAATEVRLTETAAAECLRSEGLAHLLPTRLQTVEERCAAVCDGPPGDGPQIELFRRAA